MAHKKLPGTKGQTFTFRLTAEQRRELDALARKERRTLTELLLSRTLGELRRVQPEQKETHAA